jgi:glucose/arabinose dehydrogenase
VARILRRALAVGGTVVVMAGLVGFGVTGASAGASTTGVVPLADRQIVTGIDIPWGITFLPDGSAYVAERDTGRVLRITPAGRRSVVGTVPGTTFGGEGGLLGLAVAPGFNPADGRLFAYQTVSSGNRIVRIRVRNHRFAAGDVTQILGGIARSTFHNGGRLRFGPDGMLYATTGDAQTEGANSQNPRSLNGKILRMTQDGRPPTNPPNQLGGVVYSMGHRNVQGIAWDSRGRLWASEFGPSTVDELNLIMNGRNYGWGGCKFAPPCVAPKRTWPVSFASPSGITIINDTILIACLRGQKIIQLRINGNGVTGQTVHHTQYGRVRTVERAPGGGYWMSTSNRDANGTPRSGDDRIILVI